tara:strand:- start:906 stop:1658 length:753 start_codon:yes stop_codon:yes gene_type:complete
MMTIIIAHKYISDWKSFFQITLQNKPSLQQDFTTAGASIQAPVTKRSQLQQRYKLNKKQENGWLKTSYVTPFQTFCRAVLICSTSLVFALPSTGVAKEVPRLFKQVAYQQKVPPELLYAIAIQESSDPKRKKIWPWTINVKGKGFYFPDRQTAYDAVKLLHQNNIKSVDIGLMQTNWRWQKHRLKSVWKAFEPAYNVKVGAQILRDCYVDKKSWWICTGLYHSPGRKSIQKQRAENYRRLVYSHLKEIKS